MKKITFSIVVLLFCLLPFLSNAQNATATLGNVAGKNKGDTIRIPLYVKGFKNIGAFGLAIIIDTNVLTNIPGDSSCVTNIIAALKNGSNFFGSNFGSKVAIYWMYKGKWKDSIVTELKMAFSVSGMNGINIPDGKLLDLVFLYKGGIAPICFDTLLCEVDDNNINILPVTYNCGNVNGYLTSISQFTNTVAQISDIFPNPVSETANIYISAQYPVQSAQLSVEIYNQIGQKVASKSYKYTSGNQIISFNTSGLSKGLYFVRISCNNINGLRKFVKL